MPGNFLFIAALWEDGVGHQSNSNEYKGGPAVSALSRPIPPLDVKTSFRVPGYSYRAEVSLWWRSPVPSEWCYSASSLVEGLT